MIVTRSGAGSPVGECAGGDNCTACMGKFEENCMLGKNSEQRLITSRDWQTIPGMILGSGNDGCGHN